ncbi:hypothetical protein BT93_L5616 [Corymbia citriodora subsp. variegata]|uniref:NADH dehydrogenase n=1 Tax=Corymbia citriodora subsp. variegata TaxID=360336 RepID=A0A8T0CFZ6_CORYI|nr:hypothetical protein BT93_L5616 [Corymbia citriodora subsp. variegata]
MQPTLVRSIQTNSFPVGKKFTQQSYGLYEKIRRFFAVDPDRSNGIPVKNYRNPPPGALDPKAYDDPVTLPAGDIADNPYWRRDIRRAYPKLSTITQGDAVGLLTMGSAANPSPKLLRGEEGGKQLVAVKADGERGLAVFFEKEADLSKAVLDENGMPPMPVAFRDPKVVQYDLTSEQGFGPGG